jgi:hypothetical protein
MPVAHAGKEERMAPSFKPWPFESLFGSRKPAGCLSLSDAAEPASRPAELPAYFQGTLMRVVVAAQNGPAPDAAVPVNTLVRCDQPVGRAGFVPVVDALPAADPSAASGAAWREVRVTFNKLEDVRQITSYDELLKLPPGTVTLTPTPGAFRCALAPGQK